jgi:NAD(P)-dependent dehydrogenase (short-subunit alcohol dehydrogenase family)
MNKDGVAETVRLIQAEHPHVKVLPVVMDVTDEASVNAMVDEAVKAFGTLDCGEKVSSLFRRVLPCRELTLS